MKTILTIFISLFLGMWSYAQNGINYKAIIKDNLGNVVANDLVIVQFAILQGVAQTNVYQESHAPTTDANGLIIVNIGEGTTSDVFSSITWSADDHFLNVQIDTGSGLVDMGTTQFMSVPYAKNAETAANVTGLEAINEGFGIGWRLKGRDPNNYGNISLNAVDLSYNETPSTTKGATEYFSVAMGSETTASGFNSTAMGSSTIASGYASTAMGASTTASNSNTIAMGSNTAASGESSLATGYFSTAPGYTSTAMGFITEASGYASTAMGNSTKAESFNSTALGQYNIGGGTANSWVATDPLFEIGSGIDNTTRANALTILKNGSILAPSLDLAEITNPKALITKEYADTNLASTEFVSENGVTHTTHVDDNFVVGSQILNFTGSSVPDNTKRMFFNKAKAAFRAGGAGVWYQGGLFNRPDAWDDANVGYGSFASGLDNMASGDSSSAMGFNNTAAGDYSTAMGSGNSASGEKSTSMGYNSLASGTSSIAVGTNIVFNNYSTASGDSSVAIGKNVTASGEYSTALGSNTQASGTSSTSMGSSTNASGEYSTAMGYNNTASGYSSTAMGRSNRAQSYASLAIGRLNVGGGNATSWVETDPLFEIGNGYSTPFFTLTLNALTVLKNGKVGIGTSTPSTYLHLTKGSEASTISGSGYFMIGQETSENLVFDTNEIMARNNGATSTLQLQQSGGDVRVGGTIVHSSDRRLKKDISSLSYGLETVLQLNPVEYNWKNRVQDHKSFGLIAQEVQPIIKNIVHIADDEAKTLSVSYTELIPVLINAVKELKAENDALRSRVETLEKNK